MNFSTVINIAMKFPNINPCVSNLDAGEIWRLRKERDGERESVWWNTSEWRAKHKGEGDEEGESSEREHAEGTRGARPCSVIHHLLSMPVPWQAPRAKPIHAFHSGDFTRTRHFSSHGVAASSFSDTKRIPTYRANRQLLRRLVRGNAAILLSRLSRR